MPKRTTGRYESVTAGGEKVDATATRAIEMLAEIRILMETTGKKRDRSFTYRAYMERLRTGTELDFSR